MKKYLAIALVAALSAAAIVLMLNPYHSKADTQLNNLSRPGGVYYSPVYLWRGFTETSITVTGSSTTVVLGPSVVSLPDGRTFHPFGAADNQLTPVVFDQGANAETITPTAVSVTTCPTSGDFAPPAQCVTFTGTFTNTHGPHTFIASGTQGINEAIADAGSNGGGMVYWEIDSGIVTLSTGSADTNMGTVSIPTRSVVLAASARVTTTIGTCAGGWGLGVTAATSNLTATNTTLTAGTTTDSSTLTTQPLATGAAIIPIVHCTTSNASSGAMHAHFVGYKVVAPLS